MKVRDGGTQDVFPVWENVLLIEAADSDEAWDRATARAREDETDADNGSGTTFNGRTAGWVFEGIRKVLTVSHQSAKEELGSGDEITFSEFLLTSEAEVRNLADGKEVSLRYSDL
jgi:hypothetical protein